MGKSMLLSAWWPALSTAEAQARRRPWSHSRRTCAARSSGRVHDMLSPGAAKSLSAVFLDGEVAQPRAASFLVVHEADGGDVGLDDVDLLQRRDNQELQAHLLEQLEAEARRLVGAAPECLVDDHEMEGARARCSGIDAELIGEAGGQ